MAHRLPHGDLGCGCPHHNPDGDDDVDEMPPFEHGGCWQKACDVVLCDVGAPELEMTGNPVRGHVAEASTENDRLVARALDRVIDAVTERERDRAAADKARRALDKLDVVYNPRLLTTIGRCMFAIDRAKDPPVVTLRRIEITGLVELPADQLYNTLVHEFCHAARAVLSDDYSREPAHGPDWKLLMLAAGEKPETYCTDPKLMKQIGELRSGKRKPTPSLGIGTLPPRPQISPLAHVPPPTGGLIRPFRVGDRVSFLDDKGKRRTGWIIRMGKKRVTIDASGWEWGIEPAHLEHA